jgi:hypothetical protein
VESGFYFKGVNGVGWDELGRRYGTWVPGMRRYEADDDGFGDGN